MNAQLLQAEMLKMLAAIAAERHRVMKAGESSRAVNRSGTALAANLITGRPFRVLRKLNALLEEFDSDDEELHEAANDLFSATIRLISAHVELRHIPC
jgi:hypothetical protein